MPNPFEEIGAKGAGALKQAQGAIKGLHGVFNTLVKQHGEVSMLLERTKLSSDPAKRLDLWSKIRGELLAHEQGELEVVYPAFRQHAELRAYAEEHDQEAGSLEAMISELDGIDTGSEAWMPKFEALVQLVKHHVEEEEGRFFPDAADVFSKEESADLDQRFLANKESAQQGAVGSH